jgi:hypothetical protein
MKCPCNQVYGANLPKKITMNIIRDNSLNRNFILPTVDQATENYKLILEL